MRMCACVWRDPELDLDALAVLASRQGRVTRDVLVRDLERARWWFARMREAIDLGSGSAERGLERDGA